MMYPPGDKVSSGNFNEDCADEIDLSYQDAMADAQFTLFLKREYDAQAPSGSFEKFMTSLEAREALEAQPNQAPKPVLSPVPLFRWRPVAFANTAGHFLSRPVIARAASGMAAVALLLAALGPNLAALNSTTNAPRQVDSEARSALQAVHANDQDLVTRSVPARETVTQVYDRAALLSNDPPETLAPPRQNIEYPAVSQPSEEKTEPAKVRQE